MSTVFDKETMKLPFHGKKNTMEPFNSLITDIFKMILFCIQQKKEITCLKQLDGE